MAAVQRKLVHKQFNSPMGLYSMQNVKETLDRELRAFGADGIEVDEQIAKPLNLANSAVLRAVEEEEEMKCGYKRVAWPPVSEERIVREFTPQPQSDFAPQVQQQQPPTAGSGAAPTPYQECIYNNSEPVDRVSSPYPNQYQTHGPQQQELHGEQQQQEQDHYQQQDHHHPHHNLEQREQHQHYQHNQPTQPQAQQQQQTSQIPYEQQQQLPQQPEQQQCTQYYQGQQQQPGHQEAFAAPQLLLPVQYTQAQYSQRATTVHEVAPLALSDPHEHRQQPQQQQQQQQQPQQRNDSTNLVLQCDRQQLTIAGDTATATASATVADSGSQPIQAPAMWASFYAYPGYPGNLHQFADAPGTDNNYALSSASSTVATSSVFVPQHSQLQPKPQPQSQWQHQRQQQQQQQHYPHLELQPNAVARGATSYNQYEPPKSGQPAQQQPSPHKAAPFSPQYQHPSQGQQPQGTPLQYRAQSQPYSGPPYQQQQQQQPQQQLQQPSPYQAQSNQYKSQAQQQQQLQQYQQQYQFESQSNQYNSYSQPQQSQPQQQPYPQEIRSGSPGIITLRKEAPVTQKPSPLITSQPAAVSFKGGANMRGDLKWPPPEYKEQAARENEERLLLAKGPVCRPRKVKRDYTEFFAKNRLNCYYPSYKVPPGTQHMTA